MSHTTALGICQQVGALLVPAKMSMRSSRVPAGLLLAGSVKQFQPSHLHKKWRHVHWKSFGETHVGITFDDGKGKNSAATPAFKMTKLLRNTWIIFMNFLDIRYILDFSIFISKPPMVTSTTNWHGEGVPPMSRPSMRWLSFLNHQVLISPTFLDAGRQQQCG